MEYKDIKTTVGSFFLAVLETFGIAGAANAPSVPAVPHSGLSVAPSLPIPSGLTMGPYREYVGFAPAGKHYDLYAADRDQAVLLSDEKKLDKLLADCTKEGGACNPNVRAFQQVIEKASINPDSFAKTTMNNAWVNTAIPYDVRENKAVKAYNEKITHGDTTSALPYKDIAEIIQHPERGAVCYEQARIKYYMNIKSGIPAADTRLVTEALYDIDQKGGIKFEANHAVVLVHTKGTDWVMNNQQFDDAGRNPLRDRIYMNSEVESAWTHLNSGAPGFHPSVYSQSNQFPVPLFSAGLQSSGVFVGPTEGVQRNAISPYMMDRQKTGAGFIDSPPESGSISLNDAEKLLPNTPIKQKQKYAISTPGF